MRRITAHSLAALIVLALLGSLGIAQASEKRIALVMGNDRYQNFGVLRNAGADARAVADKLRALGFKVSLHLNLDSKATLRAVRQFKQQISGGDEAVFYFSGHGVQLEAANYLLPVDITAENIDQVKDDALALQRVLDDMQEQKARFSLAIIDACRDNPFKVKGRAIGGRGLAPTTAANGQMVLYSAGAGQQALDQLNANDSNPNGLFTRVLLKQMDQPGLSIDRVLRKVRDEVVRLAKSVGHDQVPALYDQAIGEFYFKPAGVQAIAAPQPTLPPATPALQTGQVFRDCEDCPEMVVIPEGDFNMGSASYISESNRVERPLHPVRVSSFAMAKTEVTRGQFAAFINETGYRTRNHVTINFSSFNALTGKSESGTRTTKECFTYENRKLEKRSQRSWDAPGFEQENAHPVSCVDSDDAVVYLEWLSHKSGKKYRLPSEAEWEYAARAGTAALRYWGNEPDQACVFENVADQVFKERVGGDFEVHQCNDGYAYTAPVATFKPNAFGLYDMLGNVGEWVADCMTHNYVSATSDGSVTPVPRGRCEAIVFRGGSWYEEVQSTRSASRQAGSSQYSYVGFRPVRVLP